MTGLDAADGLRHGTSYERYRCGLHHSGQTDGDFRVQRSGDLIRFDGGRIVVNHTEFHRAIKPVLENHLRKPADPEEHDLRRIFRMKMDPICGIDFGTA